MAKAKVNRGKKVFMTVAIIGGSAIGHIGMKQLDKVTKLDPVLTEEGKYKNLYLRPMIEGGAALITGGASVFIPNDIAQGFVAGISSAAVNKTIDDLGTINQLKKGGAAGVGAKNKMFNLYEDYVQVKGNPAQVANANSKENFVV